MTATQELLHLTPVYAQVEGGWTQASIRELPGVITAAPSRKEAQDMLVDALREFLLSLSEATEEDGEPDGDLTVTISISDTPAA